MSEEQKKEVEKETPDIAVDNFKEGSKPSTDSIIEQADASAKRLEEANKKQEELLQRQEKLMAKQMLAGRADAGIQPIPKKEMSDIEYMEAALDGLIGE